MKMKIDTEKLKALPELLKTKTRKEVATEWGMCLSSINYWVKQYRSKGIEIGDRPSVKMIDKIISNETTI